jgi:steroid delta-isomerase-like uncharacterized protein
VKIIKKLLVIGPFFVSLAIFGLMPSSARADDQAVVQAWLAAWNSHNTDTFVGIFTENAVFEHVPLNSVSRGPEEIRAFAQFVFTALPDLKITILNSSAKGGDVTIEWLFSATDKGFYGTGKPFAVRGVTVIELHGTKIVRASDYWDSATILRQVGLLPPGL